MQQGITQLLRDDASQQTHKFQQAYMEKMMKEVTAMHEKRIRKYLKSDDTFRILEEIQTKLNISPDESEKSTNRKLKKLNNMGNLIDLILMLILFQLDNDIKDEKEIRNGMALPLWLNKDQLRAAKDLDDLRQGRTPKDRSQHLGHSFKVFFDIFDEQDDEEPHQYPVRELIIKLMRLLVDKLETNQRTFQLLVDVAQAAREEAQMADEETLDLRNIAFLIRSTFGVLEEFNMNGEMHLEYDAQMTLVTTPFLRKLLTEIIYLNGENYHPISEKLVHSIKKRTKEITRVFIGDEYLVKKTKHLFVIFCYNWLMSPCLDLIHQVLIADLATAKKLAAKASAETRTLILRSMRIKTFALEEERKNHSLLHFFILPKLFLFNHKMKIGFRSIMKTKVFRKIRKLIVQIPNFLRQILILFVNSGLNIKNRLIWNQHLAFAAKQASLTVTGKNSTCKKTVRRIFGADGWDFVETLVATPDEFSQRVCDYASENHLVRGTKFSSTIADLRALLEEASIRFPSLDVKSLKEYIRNAKTFMTEDPSKPKAIPFSGSPAFRFIIEKLDNVIVYILQPTISGFQNMIIFPEDPIRELLALLSFGTHLCIATRPDTCIHSTMSELERTSFAIMQNYKIFKTNGASDGCKRVLSITMNDLSFPSLDTFLQFYELLLGSNMRTKHHYINPMSVRTCIIGDKKFVSMQECKRKQYRAIAVKVLENQNIPTKGKPVGFYSGRYSLLGMLKNAIKGHEDILALIAGHKWEKQYDFYYYQTDIREIVAPEIKEYLCKHNIRIPAHWENSLRKIAKHFHFMYI